MPEDHLGLVEQCSGTFIVPVTDGLRVDDVGDLGDSSERIGVEQVERRVVSDDQPGERSAVGRYGR